MRSKTRPQDSARISVKDMFAKMDETCLVVIDRSMWFAKAYDALAVGDFAALVARHSQLRGHEQQFCTPVVYAFSYAQRVFLCSAMELCLLLQHLNSVALLIQIEPSRTKSLVNLEAQLKKKRIKSLDEWLSFSWETRFQYLRELSFSSLKSASRLFDDIYGPGCFDAAWGTEVHQRLASQYHEYQTLRNGILHRGGELNSGIMIEANESDLEATFEDSRRFRDSILELSNWCHKWWVKRCARGIELAERSPS
jgi:hypothetical protein